MEFRNRLKELRSQKGLSQVALAEKLQVSKSIIGAYETGDRKPSYEILELLADFFNVSIDYLTGKENASMYYINPEAALLVQEVSESPKLKTLVSAAKELNEKGQDKLIEHAQLLAASKRYVKEAYFNPSSYTVNPSHMSMVAEDTVEYRCGDCDDSATNK